MVGAVYPSSNTLTDLLIHSSMYLLSLWAQETSWNFNNEPNTHIPAFMGSTENTVEVGDCFT